MGSIGRHQPGQLIRFRILPTCVLDLATLLRAKSNRFSWLWTLLVLICQFFYFHFLPSSPNFETPHTATLPTLHTQRSVRRGSGVSPSGCAFQICGHRCEKSKIKNPYLLKHPARPHYPSRTPTEVSEAWECPAAVLSFHDRCRRLPPLPPMSYYVEAGC
ncbi:hypothetical protein K438DRAFT_1926713 [Mycena galopus ATCC 62051]|nr:hypothetical protein K438DRAFT_1926713 [Mycena galopus ATCC 62051]